MCTTQKTVIKEEFSAFILTPSIYIMGFCRDAVEIEFDTIKPGNKTL